ncbi:MAG: SRPBCC family protein [Chitinivibrionales bacterium]|nr:SRPBCC family protein [Chitinivibrionales bacterium]
MHSQRSHSNPIYAWIAVLMVSGGLTASIHGQGRTLSFSDTGGVIVKKKADYIIRQKTATHGVQKSVEALFWVEAPASHCFSVITDYPHYPEFMPNIHRANKVSQTDSTLMYDFDFKAALATIEYTLLFRMACPGTVGKKRTKSGDTCWVRWDYVKGSMKENNGAWRIVQGLGRDSAASLVHYSLTVEPGFAIPASISNYLLVQSIPGMIEAIRARVRQSLP